MNLVGRVFCQFLRRHFSPKYDELSLFLLVVTLFVLALINKEFAAFIDGFFTSVSVIRLDVFIPLLLVFVVVLMVAYFVYKRSKVWGSILLVLLLPPLYFSLYFYAFQYFLIMVFFSFVIAGRRSFIAPFTKDKPSIWEKRMQLFCIFFLNLLFGFAFLIRAFEMNPAWHLSGGGVLWYDWVMVLFPFINLFWVLGTYLALFFGQVDTENILEKDAHPTQALITFVLAIGFLFFAEFVLESDWVASYAFTLFWTGLLAPYLYAHLRRKTD